MYEEEGDLVFRDLSERAIADDVFARLPTFPNVLVTGHQGLFTHEALTAIAETTLDKRDAVAAGEPRFRVSIDRLLTPPPARPTQQAGAECGIIAARFFRPRPMPTRLPLPNPLPSCHTAG